LGPYGPSAARRCSRTTPRTCDELDPPIDLERRDDSDGRDYEIDSIKGAVDIALDEALELNGDVTYGLTTKRELAFVPFAIARANVS
jgi:hypothetical protein